MGEWRFLSNHGRVLVFVARQPDARLRDIAERVGITERSAHRIISELCEDGYLSRKQNGRRNHYAIRPDIPIHDPLLRDHWVGEILAVVAPAHGWESRGRSAKRRSSGRRTPGRRSGTRR
jgi:MarR family